MTEQLPIEQGNGVLFSMEDLLPLLARNFANADLRVREGKGDDDLAMTEYGIEDAQAYGNLWSKNLMAISVDMRDELDPDEVCAMLCFAAHVIGYQIAVERLTNNPED